MGLLTDYLHRRLSPREIVVIVLGAAAVAGVIYGIYCLAVAQILEARVNAAIPKVQNAIREQRARIARAVEAYKAQYGAFPPDHVIGGQASLVDPITNTLLYELTGVLYNPKSREFQVAGLEPAEERYVTNFFQIGRFKNCSDHADQLKHFLGKDDIGIRQLHDDPDVFALGFNLGSVDIAPELFWEIDVGSWCYVCSTPTNNPGKFDLWITLKHQDRVITVGNWKETE